MSNSQKIDYNATVRMNPTLRVGTWERVKLYAQANNLEASPISTALDKIIHDHCDYLQIPDPFDKVLKN